MLNMAAQGYTDDRIAAELKISVATVRGYWLRVRGKLGGTSRTELASKWIQLRSSAEGDRVAQEHLSQSQYQQEEFQRLLADERSAVDRMLKDGTPSQRQRIKEIRNDSDRAIRALHEAGPASSAGNGLD